MRGRLLLGLAFAAAACGPQRLEKTELDLAAAVTEALARGDTATLRVFVEVPFAFDRLYIAGPHATEQSVAAALQSDAWQPEMMRGLESADHFHLMIFQVGDKIYPAALPRSVADIAPDLANRLYGPDEAVFSVRRSDGQAAPMLSAIGTPPASAGPAPE